MGASLRMGPELEISGYGCNDHFYEVDTYTHSMEVLAKLMDDDAVAGIIVDVGMCGWLLPPPTPACTCASP
jgi:NAD+ synthase (glutamine-hydrolysing)